MTIETVLTPAEIAGLPARPDLRGVTCVVFDVLRATSTILTALGDGNARAVWPAATLAEAAALREKLGPGTLLGGERNGRALPGFDFGNSPREVADPAAVGGRDLVTTTTNGTVALRACARAGAGEIHAGALLNLGALAAHLRAARPGRLLLVCAGTHAGFALEDALGAGALVAELSLANDAGTPLPDATHAVLALFRAAAADLPAALRGTDNGRRLEEIGLGGDVAWCAAVSRLPRLAVLGADGAIRGQQ